MFKILQGNLGVLYLSVWIDSKLVCMDPHQKLEFFKLCVRTTLSQLGQITSSMEKQELLLLETTLGNLYCWKEEIVMAPPGQTANGLMIYIHSTVEIILTLKRPKQRLS